MLFTQSNLAGIALALIVSLPVSKYFNTATWKRTSVRYSLIVRYLLFKQIFERISGITSTDYKSIFIHIHINV